MAASEAVSFAIEAALSQLLDAYIPRETQAGFNDPATLAAQKQQEPAAS